MSRRAQTSSFDVFCRDSIDLIRSARTPFLLIGGLAVIALGVARTTADIDLVAYADPGRGAALIDLARAAGFTAAHDELARMEATGTLRFKRGPFQLDIILASLPFESAALERAQRKRLFGRLVPLPTPEDLLLFKVLAGRDKDLHDAVGIARRHLARLDRRYLERSINQVCDLAEDLTAKRQLEAVLAKAASA